MIQKDVFSTESVFILTAFSTGPLTPKKVLSFFLVLLVKNRLLRTNQVLFSRYINKSQLLGFIIFKRD